MEIREALTDLCYGVGCGDWLGLVSRSGKHRKLLAVLPENSRVTMEANQLCLGAAASRGHPR